MKGNHFLLVFCHTVGAMLPFFPLGYLDLGVVWGSQPKVWVDDDFVHLCIKQYIYSNLKNEQIPVYSPNSFQVTFTTWKS